MYCVSENNLLYNIIYIQHNDTIEEEEQQHNQFQY